MHNAVKILLLAIFVVSFQYSYAHTTQDTTSVYFRLDVPSLDAPQLAKIDSLLYHDIINQQQKILIIGYADHLGSNEYNDTLSTCRANNVRAYLLSMGIPDEHITLCIGRGEVPRKVELPKGYAADRRVDIVPIDSFPPSLTRVDKPERMKEKIKLIESKDAIVFNSETPFDITTVEIGQLYVLNKIWFYTGRHKVVDASLGELDKLFDVLDENPTLVINIEGHVCCVHPSVDALDEETGEVALSLNRAKYIYKYLVKRGIDEKRMTYEGYGKTRPLRYNEFTQEDQDMNKRVEIRIIKK